MEDRHEWVPTFDDGGSGVLDDDGMEDNDHWWGMEGHYQSTMRMTKQEGQGGLPTTAWGAPPLPPPPPPHP